MLPSHIVQEGDVQELLWHAVWFSDIPSYFALVIHYLRHHFGELSNGNVLSRANIDDLISVVVFHQENASIGHILAVHELPSGDAGAPDFHERASFFLRFIEAPD